MPLHISWDNDEKTVIRCEGEGRWTWDEYHTSLENIMDMIRTVNHPVDLIIIERPGSAMPPGSPQPHFQRVQKLSPPNMGHTVIVVRSALAKAMSALLTRLPGNLMGNVNMVGSLDEAHAFIKRERTKSQFIN